MEPGSSPFSVLDGAIVLAFLIGVSYVGWRLSKAASAGIEDYFLGGKKIPWWLLGVSTATSNFDMAGTMIIVAMVYSLGYRGFLVELRGGTGLTLAFLLVFLGKWLRRSRVMTSAEWMKLRFGTDRPGKAAHLLSAVANVVLSIGMIIYFCKGAGKFMTTFIPVPETVNTTVMVSIGLFYTLMSGLYGVVFTDLIQMVLLGFAAIYVSWLGYTAAADTPLPDGFLDITLASPGPLADALVAKDPASWTPIVSFFGVCVALWATRTVLEGCGGVGGYVDQRFFAARSEREAGLLTFESIVLSGLRWTMVAGLAVLGHRLVAEGGAAGALVAADGEQTLPVVIATLLPSGIRGIVVAGLFAAAMSTFDSTLNAGAAYVVRDIYQSYIHPDASEKQLVRASRWATIGLCVVGVGAAALVPNINAVWGLITMGLGAGLFVPLFLRWYWPRLNGWGFAGGTAAGMVAGLGFQGALAWPLYWAFPSVIAVAALASVLVSLATPPVERAQLVRFVHQINPFGPWSGYEAEAQSLGLLGASERSERRDERRRDVIAVVFALVFQTALLIGGMSLIFRDFETARSAGVGLLVGGLGLWWFWYRNLRADVRCAAEDEQFADLSLDAYRSRPR